MERNVLTKSELFSLVFKEVYIDPFNKQFYYIWLIISSMAFIYNLIVIIARISFWLLQDFYKTWTVLDYLFADLIYIIDIVINFFTGFIHNGELCINKKEIGLRYIKSSKFIIDVFSILPLEMFLAFLNLDPSSVQYFHPMLRLNRLLRTNRLSEFRSITETKTKYPTVFRMTNLLVNILLGMHWNACTYFIISRMVGFGKDNWVFPALTKPELMSNMTRVELNNVLSTHRLDVQYIYCFWWSVLTLTTIGEVRQPTEYYQEMYMSVLLMVGVVILAITIGIFHNL